MGRQERVAGGVEWWGLLLGLGLGRGQAGDGAPLHARRRVLDRVLHRLLQGVWGQRDTTIMQHLQIFLMQEVSICTLGPDFDQDGHVDGAKFMRIVYGEWQADSTAGGCRNDLKLFATNPQFLLTIHPVRNDKFGVLQNSNIWTVRWANPDLLL